MTITCKTINPSYEVYAMKIVSFFTFCCCLLGVSFLGHVIGDFGMKQGVDELLVACTVFPVMITGMVGMIVKWEL